MPTNGTIAFYIGVPSQLIERAAPLPPAQRTELRAYLKHQLYIAVWDADENIQRMIDEAMAD